MTTPHKKATRAQTKIHNTRLILKTIYDHGQISRAEIARLTKLTRPTVSAAVSRLIDEGLVTDVGRGPSTGGKQPTLVSIVKDARHMLGVDLAGRTLRGGVVDLEGGILHRTDIPIDDVVGDEALHRLDQLIAGLLEQTTSPLLGIGIGSPGLIDTEKGFVRRSVNLGWEDLPLRDLLAERFPGPIYVANDSHVTALADYTYGDRETSPNRVVIKVGRGIGAGIVINGDLYQGDSFGAGEIGHVVVAADGPQCTCGNYGCLETIASTSAILREAKIIADSQANSPLSEAASVTWETVGTALTANDPHTVELVEKVGRALGVAIANLIAALNIHQVVISGRVTEFGEFLIRAIRSEVQRHVLPAMAAETCITYTSIGKDIGILGSAAMLLKNELGIV